VKPNAEKSEAPAGTAAPAKDQLVRALEDLARRAESGDESARPDLRKYLEDPVQGARLMDAWGNLAAMAEQALMDLLCGKDIGMRVALHAKLKALRAEVAGPEPSPVERLLAERVVACWLQVHHADYCSAAARNVPIPERDYHHRRQDRAHARYLAALKALATIRKLLRPALAPLDLATRPVEETAATRRGRTARATGSFGTG
jgi:hypothetical protein